MKNQTQYYPAGDCAICVEFGTQIHEDINNKVRRLQLAIESKPSFGIIEMTPTYCSLLIEYDSRRMTYSELVKTLKTLDAEMADLFIPEPVVIEIPTLYGGISGPDLTFVAEHCKMSEQEVIDLHTKPEYRIYMLGFTPGFPYLGGMSEQLSTPRLKTPRTKIPAGSVGIAGSQTGIYPVESPGGWQLIGRTPLKLYDPNREKPFLVSAGNYIKYVAITEAEYSQIEFQVISGQYQTIIKSKGR